MSLLLAVVALEWWAKWLIAVGMVAGTWALGDYLARRLRMPDYGWKIWLVLLTFAFGVTVTTLGWPPRLGVDLKGGLTLIYQVDPAEMKSKNVNMDAVVEALSRRVNPGGVKEVVVRQYGPDGVEIVIPRIEDPNEIKHMSEQIASLGSLEFRILANRVDDEEIIKRAENTLGRDVLDVEGNVVAKWYPIRKGYEDEFGGAVTRTSKEGGRDLVEVLVKMDKYNVQGGDLVKVDKGFDSEKTLKPCVEFTLTQEGGARFAQLTSDNRPQGTHRRQLAIILDRQVVTAPSLETTIHSQGRITSSRFEEKIVRDYVNVLRSGTLPAALIPNPSVSNSSPLLGADMIRKSATAMAVSVVLILVFMVTYYRFSGLVADFALVINIFGVVALMISMNAAFTLSGLAGLALTVGMAVDNNVLIYERLREERESGASLRMAIRNAFQRVWTVIIDSHVTSLIASVVLFSMGSEQIKGFAVTLIIGVALNMFTAVFCARVVFDICERQKWLTEARMMKVLGDTRIDFMKLFPYFLTFSILITVGGLIATAARGTNILDIDFTGGTSAQIVFSKDHDIEDVRTVVSQHADELPGAVITALEVTGEPPNRMFVVNTAESDGEKVTQILKKLFGPDLATNRLKVAKTATSVEKAAKDKKASDAADDDTEKPAEKYTTTATVDVQLGMSHDTLVKLLKDCYRDVTRTEVDIPVNATAAGFVSGERKAYSEWQVSMAMDADTAQKVFAEADKKLAAQPYFPATNTVKGNVAADTCVKATWALVISWGCTLIYLWIRFQGVAFGLAAVVALVHDVLVMLGAVALSYWLATPMKFLLVDQFKINLPIIAAFLTIIGYSVNDTIVIFDRIREIRGKMPYITRQMVNDATNQTLSRTIITALTVLVVVVVLYIFGGEALRGMSFALTVGVTTGCYSSIYIAAPILLWMVGEPKPHEVQQHESASAARAADARA